MAVEQKHLWWQKTTYWATTIVYPWTPSVSSISNGKVATTMKLQGVCFAKLLAEGGKLPWTVTVEVSVSQ